MHKWVFSDSPNKVGENPFFILLEMISLLGKTLNREVREERKKKKFVRVFISSRFKPIFYALLDCEDISSRRRLVTSWLRGMVSNSLAL
jgi:hypothetical protein